MVQTEWLSPDAAGWEISPIFAHQNAVKQTVRRPQKGKEKALKPSGFKAFPVAGAEGLEPSARGFGAAVEKMKHPANPPLLQPFGCTHRRVDALLMLLYFGAPAKVLDPISDPRVLGLSQLQVFIKW